MRLWIVTALLCAVPAAFGQAVSLSPAQPEPYYTTPPGSAVQGFVEHFLAPAVSAYVNRPPKWHAEEVAPPAPIKLPPQEDARLRDNQIGAIPIDPQIVVRPPQSSLGEQAPGKEIAQNQYPGLTLLPIQDSKSDPKPLALPIPTIWPNRMIEDIPTHWQQNVIKPAGGSYNAKPPNK